MSGILPPALLGAQQDPLNQAYALERRGNFAAAADLYREVLAKRPAEVAALLGLERSLSPLNRLPEILPQVRAALVAGPANGAVHSIALRAWAAADQPDSLRAAAERWAAVAPQDETPYREWGMAALARHDRQGARKAFLLGRERIGRPDVLAPELAQLAALDEDYLGATREWLLAVRSLPGYRTSAASALAQAPSKFRPDILRQLDQDGSVDGRRLGVDLRARWGDPVGAYHSLVASLPAAPGPATDALRQFLDQVRGLDTREGHLAQGMVLEALGERQPGPAQARLRLDSARAYELAGDRDGARRMLSLIAADGTAPGIAAGAASTLITLLISEGNPGDASARLEQYRTSFTIDEYENLRRTVAAGWMRAGQLDQAERTIGPDSTVEGLALRGRLQLLRGDVAGARTALQAAGPYAGTREEATERLALLALLQPLEADTVPELGAGFLALERRDSSSAAAAFEHLAGQLGAAEGGAELRLLAGRLQAGMKRPAEAERLFRLAAATDAPATAAAAELELGQLYISEDRDRDASAMLEHLILTYPESALVPQARRLLDIARGAIPRT
jgi:tetratricopeptide (TPR) repeat protein